MNETYPKISIVIPSFNQGKYLRDSIESFINQDYSNKELIIIDGGSTDGSVDIIKQYEQHFAYWVSEKDNGQTHAIQKGFRMATGDWFNWINSDDALLPGALNAISCAIRNNPDCDIIFGEGVYGHANGSIFKLYSPLPSLFWIQRYPCLGNICQQATFFSRRAYLAVEGVDTELFYRMDADLFERILEAGCIGITLKQPIGFFRVHKTTKTALNQNIRLAELRKRDQSHGVFRIERLFVRILLEFLSLISGSSFRSYIKTLSYKNKTLATIWCKKNV